MSFFRKSDIVNVKMVITEEKIVSNIDKIQKLINPNSKKQIVELEEDTYFKDLVQSVKTYLIEYPRKKTFPVNVYKSAYELVEYSTSQFEENTRKIEELIRKREKNIKLASILRSVLKVIKKKPENCKAIFKKVKRKYPKEIVEALKTLYTSDKSSEEYQSSLKIVEAKIGNLEANTFVEIDMERIEDKSKALSYIGIEISDALKDIPVPEQFVQEQLAKAEKEELENETVLEMEEIDETKPASELLQEVITENISTIEETEENFVTETRFEKKPSLWDKIKNCKLVRAIKYVSRIRIRVELPALPEGRFES